MKKLLLNLLKFSISAAIIGYLVYSAQNDADFARLASQPKHWGLLAAALGVATVATLVTFVRWYLLVRAVELPFSVRDALRLGALGYLFNFVSLGSVGGDLFKAVFIAREQPGRRAEAVATVVIDRVVGLYSMFLLASFFILIFGPLQSSVREIQIICQATLIGTTIGTVGVVMLFVPGFTQGRLSDYLGNRPRIGPPFRKLLGAIRLYRSKPAVLAAAVAASLLSHTGLVLAIFLIAQGLSGGAPDLADHFLIVPLAMVASALPLPLNGLGAFEGVVDFLYRNCDSAVTSHQGLIVALGYRVVTIVIAVFCMGIYLSHRREVAEVVREAEREEAEAAA